VLQGQILAGFISSGNIVYQKVLKKGELTVFPQGLLHFEIAIGNRKALAFPVFSSANHGLQIPENCSFEKTKSYMKNKVNLG